MNNLPQRHHRWLWPLAAACVSELMIVAVMLWQQANHKETAQAENPDPKVTVDRQESKPAHDTMSIKAVATEEPVLAMEQPTPVPHSVSAEDHDTCPTYTMEELVVEVPHATLAVVKVKSEPAEQQFTEHTNREYNLPEFKPEFNE